MKMRPFAFIHFLKRYFNNEAASLFRVNPYKTGGIQEKGDHLVRLNRRVTFIELFYDLFLVASLNVFTRFANLVNGTSIGSYAFYFCMLWTIWVTQGLYDARFASHDGTTWFYGFLQLLTYGYMSSVAGSFNVAYKFFDKAADPYAGAPQLIQRVGDGEVSSADILRALCAASGIFAVSRFILLVQYITTFRYARQAGRKQTPLLVTMAGIAINMVCWLIALGISFKDTRSSSIARLCLWVAGILIEWAATIWGAGSQHAIYMDLSYLCERFAALTLIVLGEGIIGLFEQFKTFITGAAVGFNGGSVIGNTFSVVALFRLIYYLYFSHHSHDLRGGPMYHIAWSFIHLPLQLSLLLFTQCLTKAISAANVLVGISIYADITQRLYESLQARSVSDSVSTWVAAVTQGEEGIALAEFSEQLGVNYTRLVFTYESLSQGNTTIFLQQWGSSVFSTLARLLASFDYDPPEESYTRVEYAIAYTQRPNYYDLFTDTITELMQPVFTSCVYAFTVAGTFLLCLCALGALQNNTYTKYRKIAFAYRFGLGFVLVALTCLDIGPKVTTQYLLGETNSASPIYKLIASYEFIPVIFMSLYSISLVEVVLIFWKMYDDDTVWRAAGCPRDLENVPIVAGQHAEHEDNEKGHHPAGDQSSDQDDGDIQEDEQDSIHGNPA